MPRVGCTFVRRKTGETGMNLRPDTPATQKDGSSDWQPKKRFVNISGLRSRRLKIGGVTKSGGNHKSMWTCNSSQAPSSISRNSSSVHLQKMRFMNARNGYGKQRMTQNQDDLHSRILHPHSCESLRTAICYNVRPKGEYMDIIAQLKIERDKGAQQVNALNVAIAALSGTTTSKGSQGRRTMSAAARGRISAAQKARWARTRGKVVSIAPKPHTKRPISPAGLANIRKATKARWARWRAAKK